MNDRAIFTHQVNFQVVKRERDIFLLVDTLYQVPCLVRMGTVTLREHSNIGLGDSFSDEDLAVFSRRQFLCMNSSWKNEQDEKKRLEQHNKS